MSELRQSPRILDITPVLSERIGVFPGDTPFRREIALDFEKGHHLLLSSIQSTLHVGAHTDAPNHYSAHGKGIADVSLNRYMGKCLVLHAKVPRGERVSKKHLSDAFRNVSTWPAKRILVRTESFPDPDQWNSDFCSLDPVLIEEWARAGVQLVGIDTPSIDPETAKDLVAHHMVAKYDLSILEGIVLSKVEEGFYTLIALPLKIENADAAPVRAILIEGPDQRLDFD